MAFTLADLEAIVAARANASPDVSYSAKLLAGGPARAAKKFGEEAVELALATASEGEEAVCNEAADVLYHLLIVLYARGIAVADVMEELERRTARSGLEEKASRKPG